MQILRDKYNLKNNRNSTKHTKQHMKQNNKIITLDIKILYANIHEKV